GHIKNIIKIVREAAPFSLVLLDEIGAGTDPSEGSALAMAILEELHQRGTRTVATTHINELKIFAHQREGMENASMEFDSVTLAPTYRLMIGVPGQSNALVIAERLGLDPALVSKANSFISKDFLDLEKIISRLAAEKQRFAESSRGIEEIKANMQATLREIEQEKSELEEKREGMLQKAREEAQSILRVARREAEAILKRLYRAESEKKKNTVDAFSLGQEIKANLKELQEELSPPDGQNDSGGGRRFSRVEELSEGQEVYINSLRSHGRIARISSAGEILVQAGTLRVETRLSDLSISIGKMNVGEKGRTRAAPASKQSQIELIHEKSTTLRPRIDLRGMTLDEAILKLDKYLDDALLTSLDTFDIIHGKGTGRLRQGVHHYLKNLSQVAAFRLGGQGEGGSGATIVQLKKS
ncbi:MAG: endonuclease MutS2, partial [Dethiobacteria bacterium]